MLATSSLEVVHHHLGAVLAFQRARQRAADGGGQQLLERVLRLGQAQRLGDGAVDRHGRAVDLLLHALAVLVALAWRGHSPGCSATAGPPPPHGRASAAP